MIAPGVPRLPKSVSRIFVGTPRFVHKTGTSDMNVVSAEWNCPIIAYGPGDSRLDHTPDEHIDLDEYVWAVRVLELALQTLPGELGSARRESGRLRLV